MNPRALSRIARELFVSGPLRFRWLQHLRPYTCSFEKLIEQTPPGSRVFDVGCGGGLYLGLLAACGRCSEGVGVDVAEQPVQVARLMAEHAKGNGSAARLTFLRVRGIEDWPREMFDVVSMVDVIHHVPKGGAERIIQSAAGRVRPGGLLIYKDMRERPVWMALANRFSDLVLSRQWIHYLPAQTAQQAMEACGFTCVHRESFECLWYAHELLVFRRL